MVALAVLLLPAVNTTLWLAGYRRTHRLLRLLSPTAGPAAAPRPGGDGRIEQVCRSVRIAARRGPYRASCLREALVVWWFLQWHRVEADLTIGVAKSGEEFLGHAWVSVSGLPVAGAQDALDHYAPIATHSNR